MIYFTRNASTTDMKKKNTTLSHLFSPVVWLRRSIPLMLPILLMVTGVAEPQKAEEKPTKTSAEYWAASVSAETSKEYDEAIKNLVMYQKTDGDKFLSLIRYAWLSYLKKDYIKAEETYLAAQKIEPSSINCAIGLLDAAQGLNDETKIKRAAEGLVRLVPSNYRASMLLAAQAYATRDYRKALSMYKRILSFYPDDIDAMSGTAWSDFYVGNKREALQGFTKILAVQPSYQYAQEGYDILSGKKGK
jgi:tetratricopeptide (TPR) repeat protein